MFCAVLCSSVLVEWPFSDSLLWYYPFNPHITEYNIFSQKQSDSYMLLSTATPSQVVQQKGKNHLTFAFVLRTVPASEQSQIPHLPFLSSWLSIVMFHEGLISL